jgi:type IV secretory pathway ATPase VirB11/archaellum biosynthesis ATPase
MQTEVPTVPPPEPPDSGDAWYAPNVHDQYEVVSGVVATVRSDDGGFRYDVREPALPADARAGLDRVREYFADAEPSRPRTREGAAERYREGFEHKYEQAIDRLVDCSVAGRRRLRYHALAELRCLGELTPLALDDELEVGDTDDGELVVHLADYAPAWTGIQDPPFVDRFSAERVARYTVEFAGYEIPVVRYRERLLGTDPFERKYAVLEPDRLPGDDRLIEECKERIWEAGIGGIDSETAFEDRLGVVRSRAEKLLSRRLTARNTRAWLEATRFRLRAALAEYDLAMPPVDRRFADDRLDDLVYYVLRDLVGYGQLTVPILDPELEDIEANRVDERIKVVPRGGGREPTDLGFDSEADFVNVVTQLAAEDGVELSASRPSAKVNLDPEGVDQTIRCAVALPTISEDGPHISIRKQAAEVLTPVDLVESGTLPTELVTLLWMLYEHHGVVLFSGPTGVGKTTLMNAHMPFVGYEDRPVSIDEGSREVFLPHETGVSLTTREHQDDHKHVSMADLMTETNYLNPDLEVIAEINTPASFETFGETLNTGHGVIGTTHAEDVETLINRVIEQGLAPYLLREIDLVVFPHHVDGDRYVAEAVELLSEREYEALDGGRLPSGVVEKGDRRLHWNVVARRDTDGRFDLDYAHPHLDDDHRSLGVRLFHRLADASDREVAAVEEEFHRKHRYVRYLVKEGVADVDDLFGFVSDLRTDEAATVERARSETGGAESD